MPADLNDIERAIEELIGILEDEMNPADSMRIYKRRDAAKAALLALIAELADPGFTQFVALTKRFLTHYPPDVFTGVSDDSGVRFIVKLRTAIAELEEKKHG